MAMSQKDWKQTNSRIYNTRWKNQWIFTRKQVKKNEQTLANLSPAEEATSKDEQ